MRFASCPGAWPGSTFQPHFRPCGAIRTKKPWQGLWGPEADELTQVDPSCPLELPHILFVRALFFFSISARGESHIFPIIF